MFPGLSVYKRNITKLRNLNANLIILSIDQLNAQILVFNKFHYIPPHVLSTVVLEMFRGI